MNIWVSRFPENFFHSPEHAASITGEHNAEILLSFTLCCSLLNIYPFSNVASRFVAIFILISPMLSSFLSSFGIELRQKTSFRRMALITNSKMASYNT